MLNENVGSILEDVIRFLLDVEGHDARGSNVTYERRGRGRKAGTSDLVVKCIDDLKHVVEEELCQRRELRLTKTLSVSLRWRGG